MGTTRAKMTAIGCWIDAAGAMHVSMVPVYSDDPDSENKAFSDATPSGSLQLVIAKGKPAQENFRANRVYYVDMIPADEQEADGATRDMFGGSPTLRNVAAAKEYLQGSISLAHGSHLTVKTRAAVGMPDGTEESRPVIMSGTRNDRGGIDYEVTVDPIELGVAAKDAG